MAVEEIFAAMYNWINYMETTGRLDSERSA